MNTTTTTKTGRRYVAVDRPLAPRYESDTGSLWPTPENMHGLVTILGAIGVEWLSAASRIGLMIQADADPDALAAFGIATDTAAELLKDHRSFLAGARYGLMIGVEQLDALCTAVLAALDAADAAEAEHYGAAK